MPTSAQDGTTSGNEERILAEMLCELLELPSIRVDESIFDFTGDSIKILKLVSQAFAAGLNIDVLDVFECKTIAAVAQRARENGAIGSE